MESGGPAPRASRGVARGGVREITFVAALGVARGVQPSSAREVVRNVARGVAPEVVHEASCRLHVGLYVRLEGPLMGSRAVIRRTFHLLPEAQVMHLLG